MVLSPYVQHFLGHELCPRVSASHSPGASVVPCPKYQTLSGPCLKDKVIRVVLLRHFLKSLTIIIVEARSILQGLNVAEQG